MTRKFYGNQHTDNPGKQFEYDDLVEAAQDLSQELCRSPTTEDAANSDLFPSIATIFKIKGEKEWIDVLEDAGLAETQVGKYDDSERPSILRDIRAVFDQSIDDYLVIREYQKHGSYNKSVVKRIFGTWKEACRRAGVPSGHKHGIPSEGPNGEHLASRFERRVAFELHNKEIEYIVHKPIPETRWSCDFHISEFDLWVEVDGYLREDRPNKRSFENKLQHYDKMGMPYAIINTIQDLEEKVFQRR